MQAVGDGVECVVVGVECVGVGAGVGVGVGVGAGVGVECVVVVGVGAGVVVVEALCVAWGAALWCFLAGFFGVVAVVGVVAGATVVELDDEAPQPAATSARVAASAVTTEIRLICMLDKG
jgi:hypothetical protein